MCLTPGRNYQSCLWYWAWLLTIEDQHQETIDTMPDDTRELLARHLEVMETARDLDIPVGPTIAMGITIIAQGHQNDLEPLNRYAERIERQDLAKELDHPLNWQEMEIGLLRAMMQNKFARLPTRECRGRHAGGYPKPAPPAAPGAATPGTASGDATSSGAATGTRSAQNYQQNQALFEQQALENQAQDQDQQSDPSAVSWNENQEAPDWGDKTY